VNVLIVDTSVWISYFKGKHYPSLDLALKEGRVYLPPIVAAELLSSRLKTSERDRLVDFLKELPLCLTDFEHWQRVGELRSKLSEKGFHVSTPDAHIAQCSLDLEGYLMSDDLVFLKVSKSVHLKMIAE
jgi:tRNA(fMet)-specific endonuclease VapC